MSSPESDRRTVPVLLAICGEEAISDDLLLSLEQAGCAARRQPSLVRALGDVARRPAHLVLLDVDALDERDLECIDLFIEAQPDVNILVLFSPACRRRAAQALARGAVASLATPFYPDELRAIVSQWVRRIAPATRVLAPKAAAVETPAPPEGPPARDLALCAAREITTPLAALSGLVQLMEHEESRPRGRDFDLPALREHVRRIGRVASDLLAYGEAEVDAPEDLDVARLLEEAVLDAMDAKPASRIEAATGSGGRVRGSGWLLRRAVRLLAEEVAASLPGRPVIVSSHEDESGAVEITVSSRPEGPDAPPPPSSRRPLRAKALNVLLADGIARAHGGQVVVPEEGGPCTVSLRLPSAAGRTAHAPS